MSRPGPKIPPLSVTDAQRAVLEGWLRRRTTAQALAQRSRIVLECAEGHSIMEVSRRLRIAPDTVRTWRRRFLGRGLDGLCDDPRPGVPRKITDAAITISFAMQRSPLAGAPTLSSRMRIPEGRAMRYLSLGPLSQCTATRCGAWR
ncbi:helix-turn-helix domain-containing protein [Streptomyces sp. NBC_01387]|uniref:helix-turn-helix domain-containing protein n=1 Tax=unclassified Streptomyces TaxID=2593676 RepID=UPI00324AE382|nr:helix-turn-helix domain-containing protein [Streptomyces sp. NBC_01014]